MKTQKFYMALTHTEVALLLQSLCSLRNSLIAEGRYTDAVDEVIIKVSKAKIKSIKVV